MNMKITFFTISDLKQATKLTSFERFCLWFIKEQYEVNDIEGHTLLYKEFRSKTYIISHFINLPSGYNCRCTVMPIKQVRVNLLCL